MRFSPGPGFLCLALCVCTAAGATSIVERPLAQRVRQADRVVLAQILDSRTMTPKGDPRHMVTVTRAVVGENYQGSGPAQIELVQLGGRSGLWESHVPGDATFVEGETAILILRCPDNASAPGRCNLVGLGEGKLQVVGADVLLRSISRGTFQRRSLSSVRNEIRQAKKAAR